MRYPRVLMLLLAALILAGCRAPATTPAPSPTATAKATATSQPPPPTPTPTSHPLVAPPPGLIYRVGEALLRVEADGEPRPLQPAPTPEPPEGPRYFVQCEEGAQLQCDVWVEERQAGERRNLTQTADRTESLLLNPTGASDRLFFCSSPVEDDGAGIHCRLTSVRTDGTGYSVLTDRLSSYPTLSPDGQTIAYIASAPETDERRLWLLPVDGSPRPVAWSEFGLEGWSLSLHAVSWSPGGGRLAGWAWGEKGSETFSGVAVLDLEGSAAHLLPDLNHPVYFDGYPPAPSWSPDGEWLTFLGLEEDRQTYGTWVVSSRHDEVHALARFESGGAWEYGGRAWSPDGQRLALTRHEDDPEQGIWLVTVGEWDLRPVDFPEDAQVVTWVELEE